MTPEQVAITIELALYRVADRWSHHSDVGIRQVGAALREVGEEVAKIVAGYVGKRDAS